MDSELEYNSKMGHVTQDKKLSTSTKINLAAEAAAYKASQAVYESVKRIVDSAVVLFEQGNERVLELLEAQANAQASAGGAYNATLKAELAAARKKIAEKKKH